MTRAGDALGREGRGNCENQKYVGNDTPKGTLLERQMLDGDAELSVLPSEELRLAKMAQSDA